MFRCSLIFCLLVSSVVLLLFCSGINALPRPNERLRLVKRAAVPAEAEDLDTGASAATEDGKEDLKGSESIGYGYYSYPYLGSYYSYYPYYSSYYGLGYPYYGYYGGIHDHYHDHFHGHYF